ncbi:hypothetical protein AAHE18_11G111100 [Arachis hypogaea]
MNFFVSYPLKKKGRKGNPAFAVSSAPDFSSHSAAVIPSLPLAAAFLRSVGIVLSLQQQQQQQQQQQNLHQSLASHYHLLHLVENLAEVIEHGTPDQQSDALITELSTHFEKCQQLLNSISDSISTKAMTFEGQNKKLEESEQLLNQRRDLIANYRNSVEELVKSEP